MKPALMQRFVQDRPVEELRIAVGILGTVVGVGVFVAVGEAVCEAVRVDVLSSWTKAV